MTITEVTQSAVSSIDFNNLEFGKVFTDYMLVSDFDGESWSDFSIEPLKSFEMHPATSVLHYGQAIFEGLKAYKSESGKINIFRLKDNLKRLCISAERMQMPAIDEESSLEAIKRFVKLEEDFIPNRSQGSLYIRPFMISTDHTLKAVASRTYRFMVIACPVGFYYNTPLSIYLEQNFRRAAKGGVGYAKAAGNYGASFYPTEKAKQLGFDQILWTDITNNFTLEELGSANFFYVKNGELYTPKMHDSILKGITRDTIIKLAEKNGIKVNKVEITARAFESDLASGAVDCMFATGTAAAITYVNAVTIDSKKYQIASDVYGPIRELKTILDNAKFLDDLSNDQWNVVV
ncbi:MAG: branched chain amino acid aminotransferase [Bacteroidetes bacterium]|nr:MAG: branched chain amino acid aminotransferase [Bacteroidota bacterium]